jgi:flagellar biosynthetic protein FliR
MLDLNNWMMVFLRASAMLSVFPVFSANQIPVMVRIALGALIAFLIAPLVPAFELPTNLWGVTGLMIMEVLVGLLLGFVSRMIFFALELVGGIIGFQMGLHMASTINPLSETQVTAPGSILHYLGALLWLTLDLHHYLLIGFLRTYQFLPVGQAQLSVALKDDVLNHTARIFVVATQMSAPIMAVAFIITLVFAVLGRAVPQINVFVESFSARLLAGLLVFGLTLHLMAQHIINFLRRLPEDVLHVAQLLGAG